MPKLQFKKSQFGWNWTVTYARFDPSCVYSLPPQPSIDDRGWNGCMGYIHDKHIHVFLMYPRKKRGLEYLLLKIYVLVSSHSQTWKSNRCAGICVTTPACAGTSRLDWPWTQMLRNALRVRRWGRAWAPHAHPRPNQVWVSTANTRFVMFDNGLCWDTKKQVYRLLNLLVTWVYFGATLLHTSCIMFWEVDQLWSLSRRLIFSEYSFRLTGRKLTSLATLFSHPCDCMSCFKGSRTFV